MSLGRVEFDIFREFGGKIRLGVDRVHGTYVYACHTINAVFGVNDYLVFHFIEARDWADLDAVGELASVTFVGHNMWHGILKVECCCVSRSPLRVK